MNDYLLNRVSKRIIAAGLFLLIGVSNLVIAAAPSEPIEKAREMLVGFSSLGAKSPIEHGVKVVIAAPITGYSSTRDQTDDTPWITAANTPARDGVAAANFLPLYTKIRIPELFGDKIFIIEDRMNKRFSDRIDIWFPDRNSAKEFGKKIAKVQVF